MERTTPNIRAERAERSSPYTRPGQPKIKRSSSLASFATVRSLISYALTPFRQSPTLPQHTSDTQMIRSNSESGSEDGWDGEPPKMMEGQDVFDLAAAAGREGRAFEARSEEFKSKGEIPGGRREVARRQLLGTTSLPVTETNGFPVPGQYNTIHPSPSMPVLTNTSPGGPAPFLLRKDLPSTSKGLSSNKRGLSPPPMHTPLPSRQPIPSTWASSMRPSASMASTLTTSTSNGNITSASSAALAAFLKGKEGQSMTPEDFQVIETLTHNMKSETLAASPVKTGGWSAGTPRPVRPLPSSGSENPVATSTPSRAGNAFSLGSTPPRSTPGPINPNRHRVTYLGPGMSPRRMLGKQKSGLGLKPLIDFSFSSPVPSNDESATKKRRKEEEDEHDLHVEVVAPAASVFNSAPSTPHFNAGERRDKGKVRESGFAPSPLNQSITSSVSPASTPKADAVKLGKQRAADIMKDLIEKDIQNIESPSSDMDTDKPFVIFNPYDIQEREPAASHSTPSTPRAGTRTPAKSILRTTGGTPMRGAAARLEESRKKMVGKQMSTLEKLGGKPNASPSASGRKGYTATPSNLSKHVRIESPSRESDTSEVDSLVPEPDAAPASTQTPTPATKSDAPARQASPRKLSDTSPRQPSPLRKSFTLHDEEPVKPFEVPTFTSATQAPLPTTSFQSKSSTIDFLSPSREATLAASTKAVDKPVFKPSLPATLCSSEGEQSTLDIHRDTPKPTEKLYDPKAIYLTSKDSALNVVKDALPFYTFTLPSGQASLKLSVTDKASRQAALEKELKVFTFQLPVITSIFPPKKPTAQAEGAKKAEQGGADWTCSMCMLKNPATAIEKCNICEEKRPADTLPGAHTSMIPKTSFFFGQPKAATDGGSWTCGLCGLSNPGSATVECTICQNPRS